MTATNHALTGAIIGLAVTNPFIALPLAFMSHFLLDILPHFGYKGNKGFQEALRHRNSKILPIVELALFVIILVLLLRSSVSMWVYLCALLAVLPDFGGVWNYLAYEKHGKKQNKFLYYFHIRFHRPIQRYERPWGIYIEIIYFLIALTLTVKLL
jgi:hypothetical protein